MEFEPLIQKPYTIVYFHSAASLQMCPTRFGVDEKIGANTWSETPKKSPFMRILAIYVLHPTFGLKAAIFGLQMLVDNVYGRRLSMLIVFCSSIQIRPTRTTDHSIFRISARFGGEWRERRNRRSKNEICLPETIDCMEEEAVSSNS
ncbi:hypothetical protein OROMI_000475 [Orobanche minor]